MMPAGTIKGAVTVLGDFISADAILPARFSFLKPEEMAQHVLTEISTEVNDRARRHRIIVAGEAFGYGTGRESPARAIRAAGVRVIVGGPFARMFFRNAINNGVLVLDCPAITSSTITDGDELEIEIQTGVMRWKDASFSVMPVPEIIQKIVSAGSLIDYGRKVISATRGKPS
jgi:3-isopropylmalate dehydratase small subunit